MSSKFALIGRMTGGVSSYVRQGYLDLDPSLGNTWVDLFRATAWGSDERVVFTQFSETLNVAGMDLLYDGVMIDQNANGLNVLSPDLLLEDAGGGIGQLSWLAHGAQVNSGGAQSIPNNSTTAVPMNNTFLDTDGYANTGAGSSKLTVPTGLGGWYLCGFTADWAGNTTGFRVIDGRVNGSSFPFGENRLPTATLNNPTMCASGMIQLADGDYVEATVFQNRGGSLNCTIRSFWLFRVPGTS